jgi:RNA polymerase sigma factor (sigma-70 family)
MSPLRERLIPELDPEMAELLPRLRRFAFLVTGSTADADDLVQEALARAWPKLAKGEIVTTERYLKAAIVNTARSQHRRRILELARQHWLGPSADLDGDPSARSADRLDVVCALRRLPLRQRTAIVLRYYEDLSYDQIAQLMRTTMGTAKAHISRGLVRLQKDLEVTENAD